MGFFNFLGVDAAAHYNFFFGEVASDIAQAKCARKPFFFINKKNKGNKGIGTIIPNLF